MDARAAVNYLHTQTGIHKCVAFTLSPLSHCAPLTFLFGLLVFMFWCGGMHVRVLRGVPWLRGKIVLFGRSLGGAVAIAAASDAKCKPIQGVIVENSFTSVADMAKSVLPVVRLLGPALPRFVRNPWESEKAVRGLCAGTRAPSCGWCVRVCLCACVCVCVFDCLT